MASQLQVVTRGPRMGRREQIAGLNARLRLLPEILRQRERRQDIATQAGQFNEEMGLRKKEMELAKRARQTAMGLEAAKLGATVATSDVGQKTLGGMFGGAKGGAAGDPGFFGGINTGSVIGGGLAGYGASQLAGGKNKKKKALYGAGAGALTGLLSGGFSGGNIMAGGISGLIGGLL